ncbi:MAG: TfoX/Sxy family protein [Gemmatimonadaceae bacterium]
MPYDEGLAQRIRESSALPVGTTEKRMFGGIAFMVDGHMAIGLAKEQLMARIGPDAYEAALRRKHVRPMDFTGKPMRGYVYIDEAGVESDEALDEWITACTTFVRTLPRKK